MVMCILHFVTFEMLLAIFVIEYYNMKNSSSDFQRTLLTLKMLSKNHTHHSVELIAFIAQLKIENEHIPHGT